MKEKLFEEFEPVSTEAWMKAIETDLKGADFNKKLVWRTNEGFDVMPFYRAEDLEASAACGSGAACGDTASAAGTGCAAKDGDTNDWEIRQDFSIADVARCNALAKEAAAKGAESVGLCCKNVASLTDMQALLAGIDVTRTGIHFIGSSNYARTLELFLEYLKEAKINPAEVYGSIDFDPIAYALLHGDFYSGSFDKNMDEAAEIFRKFAEVFPKFRLLGVKASLLHNSGCYNTQEIAFSLAWLQQYVKRLAARGIAEDGIYARTTLCLGIGSDYFMQIAKIRTVRKLCARKVFIHAESSAWNQSIYDPYVNLLRSATEAMSASIGGADSIHINDFSNALRESDEFSARIARNQQILLKEESFFNRVIDPASGSYYIEILTSKLAESAAGLLSEVEARGGFSACVENGFVQETVKACAAKRNEDLAKRKLVLAGVNQFPNLGEKEADKLEKPLRNEAVAGGRFAAIAPYRGAEVFEELRLQTEAYAAAHDGRRPKVFLLTCGNLAMRKARAGFATNFFGCLGYEIVDNAGFDNGADGARAAIEAGAEITVLCSSDEEYAALAAEACPLLKGKTTIVYAGAAEDEAPFRELGIDYFIHVRSNVLQTLRDVQKRIIG